MNPSQQRLMDKNLRHWKGRIDKLEARESLTEDETEELQMRKSQLYIWAYQLKHAPDLPENPGDISASAGSVTSEKAGATT